MQPSRNRILIYSVLWGIWVFVVGWQFEEHARVVEAARSDLRNRSHEIANTLSAVTRALRFRGAIFQERLEPVLDELVSSRTNSIVNPNGLLAVGLLNTEGEPVVTAGSSNLLSREIPAEREHWAADYVTFALPIAGASVSPEGGTNNSTVVLPSFRDLTNGVPRDRDFFRHEPFPRESSNQFSLTNLPPLPTNSVGEIEPPPDDGRPPPEAGDRSRGNHRPPWMRWMSEAEFKTLTARRELHGLVLVMSAENYREICTHDLWLRFVISFFAGISAVGAALALRNLSQTADLEIRLVRASELNSHLKEMNLAAAGLAHETRNPLNIIRGLAQMLSKKTDVPPDIREQTRVIMDETDKVTAQLTEFINYSRPREVRRSKVELHSAIAEVLRTLNHDLAEKTIRVENVGEALAIEADEQLLRQLLFNLIINAVQAMNEGGQLKIQAQRVSAIEASLEIRDDGPGVPLKDQQEIFKPYFTTRPKGTGLGLAVVQQIILAHGWEIKCLANEPKGTVFLITHLKLMA